MRDYRVDVKLKACPCLMAMEVHLMLDCVRLLFRHQASLSTRNRARNDISEFPKHCESKEFVCEIYQSSYTLKN